MSFTIKNVSRNPVFIFYFQGNMKLRKTLMPGESVASSSVNTNQINDLKNKGVIQITSPTGQAIAPPPQKQEPTINLRELIENNKIDYQEVFENNISVTYNETELFDVSVIIPVRNREDFAEPLYKSFIAAVEKSGLKVDFTFVEHSENPQHSKFCKKNRINYFWIKSNQGDLFNKCLAHNIGAIYSSKSKYLLFHDIDCLVQSDFFIRLFENIRNQKAKAIQNFTGRRVLYLSQGLTNRVIAGEFGVDDLSIELDDVTPPALIGAPGGSITIDRELFFEVGGYDPELFLANSPEDIFFWDKVDAIEKMYICDSPDVEIYHMNHRPTFLDNPRIEEMKGFYNAFKKMTPEEKVELIKLKSDLIKEFK
jgi:predicted glycosyltransferase involved in capsule biosynthesis